MAITNNQIIATQLFISAYGRNPDQAGLNYWAGLLDSGTPVSDVANAFASSAEFKKIYDGKTPEQIVTAMYQNELGRAPDAAGLKAWAGSGLNAQGLLASFSSTTNTEGLIHNAQTFAKIDAALSSGTGFPTGTVDNTPVIITQTVQKEVVKEVPGPTVYVSGPTVAETHQVAKLVDATIATFAQINGAAPFGAGNPAEHQTGALDLTNGSAIYTAVHERGLPAHITPTSVSLSGTTVTAIFDNLPGGTQNNAAGTSTTRSDIAFDFTIVTGVNGLTNGTTKWTADWTSPTGTVHTELQVASDGTQKWVVVGGASNGAIAIGDDIASTNVASNSANLAFAYFGGVANAHGTYEVTFNEVSTVGVSAGQTLMSVHDILHLT